MKAFYENTVMFTDHHNKSLIVRFDCFYSVLLNDNELTETIYTTDVIGRLYVEKC